jgi:hypothetical protein
MVTPLIQGEYVNATIPIFVNDLYGELSSLRPWLLH